MLISLRIVVKVLLLILAFLICVNSLKGANEITKLSLIRSVESNTNLQADSEVARTKSKGINNDKVNYGKSSQAHVKMYPGKELRAIWCGLPKGSEEGVGLKEMESNVNQIADAGFNAIFVSISSRYIEALDSEKLREEEPLARWDAFGHMIQLAKLKNLEVHAWFGPWGSKYFEVKQHPEWAAINIKGIPDKSGLCFVRPDVRMYELNIIKKLIQHYPELRGIHLEEPGYQGYDYCYCDYCRKLCLKLFDRDICVAKESATPLINNVAAFMGTEFLVSLRDLLQAERPELWLSANGSGGDNMDWRIGRDWSSWSRRHYLDFYVPQLYTTNLQAFKKQLIETSSCLAGCDLVAGIAVGWGPANARNALSAEGLKAEIEIARNFGARGFVVYHQRDFTDALFDTVRKLTR